MELFAVDGVYENGRVELDEQPPKKDRARVRVTFIPTLAETDARRAALAQRFLRRLERGVDFGTEPLPKREELYADRIARF
jgi:hypothetical protein